MKKGFLSTKLLSTFLAVTLVLGLNPGLAYATDNEEGVNGGTGSGTEAAQVAKIGNTAYATFDDAIAAAKGMTGGVTVEIYDKVTLNNSLSGSYDSVKFVGMDADAEIYLDVEGYITATGKKVAFENLILSKSEGGYIGNAGFMNVAFGVYDVIEVNYDNCTFANGAYASSGKVTYSECTFWRSHDKYGLWAYGDVEAVVDGCTFADYRGIKMYAEGAAKTVDLTVKNTDFTAVNDKPAIVLTYGESVALENNRYSSTGVFELDLDGAPNGTSVTSDVAPTCKNDNGACGVLVDDKIYTTVAQAAEVAVSGSTVTLLHNSAETVEFAEGVILEKNGYEAPGVTKVQPPAPVAKINNVEFTSLQAAVDAAVNGDTIVLLADVNEDVTVTQKADVKITIDGDKNNFYGSLTVDGRSAQYETAALNIENINFVANSITKDACINLGVSGDDNTRYTSNVTVSDCTFTGENQEKVAIKQYTGGCKNLTVAGCDADSGMHSMLQVVNIEGKLAVSGCEVYSKNGLNLNNCTNVELTDNVIDVQGYAARAGVSSGGNPAETKSFVMTGNTLTSACADGDAVIMLRASAANVALTMEKNVVVGETHFSGTTEATDVVADANYWGEGKSAPVVSEGSAPVVISSYYPDAEMTETVRVVNGLKGKGTEEQPYLINDLDELEFFRNSVNAGETKYNTPGVWVALGADIDLKGTVWTEGIGDGHSYSFDGCFDGKGHTVKNLNVEPYADSENPETAYICGGMFGYIYGSVIIRDLTIENAAIATEAAGHNVGVLVGYANNKGGKAQISNITIKGAEVNAPNAYGVGSIVGYSYRSMGTIENCSVQSATINGYSFVGGITGYSYSDAVITGCSVDGAAITATSKGAGGIAGIALDGSEIIKNTVANTAVTAPTNWGYVVGEVASEGIVIGDNTAAEPQVGGSYSTGEAVQAKIGNEYYTTLEAAIKAASASEAIILLTDIEANEVIEIGKSLTINGDGYKVSSSAARVFRVTASDVAVTMNNVNVVSIAERVGTNDVRGISIDASLENVKLTLNNCSVKFARESACDWAYAVNVSGNGKGHAVTVSGGNYEGANVINVHGAENTIVVKSAVINCTYPNNDMYAGACIWVLQEQGSKVEATGNTFNGNNAIAFNLGEGTELIESGNVDNTKYVVAKVGETYYHSLEEALNASQPGDVINLLRPYVVKEGKTVALDLNGKTIVGKPTKAEAYAVITNYGDLTINDSVGGGKILCEHTIEGSTGYAVNTINNSGVLTINGGTIENTSTSSNQIGYAIDNNSTSYDAVAVINGGIVTVGGSGYYDGIRQFCNNETKENSVTVNGGEVSSIWLQNPSDGTAGKNTKDVKGSVSITGGEVDALYLEPSSNFDASISGGTIGRVSAFETAEGRDLTSFISGGTFSQPVDATYCAVGYIPVDNGDSTYGVKAATEAIVIHAAGGVTTHGTLKEAIKNAEDGSTVYLLVDVKSSDALVIDKSITVVGLAGQTISFTGHTGFQVTAAVDFKLQGVCLNNSGMPHDGATHPQLVDVKAPANVTLSGVETNEGTHYAVNMRAASAGADLIVENSSLCGSNVLNIWGSNHNVAIENSSLSSTSLYEYVFGAIVFNSSDQHNAAGNELSIDDQSALFAYKSSDSNYSYLVYLNGTGANELKTTIADEAALYPISEDDPAVWAAAEVDGTLYGTLASAVAASDAGETVTVLADHASSNVRIEKDVVIDLGGNTLEGNIFVSEGVSATVKNGSIVNENKDVSGIESIGDLVLENVDITSARHAVRIEGGTATITGGTYKVGTAGLTTHAVNVSGDSQVTIEDGVFVGPAGTANSDSGAAVNVQTGSFVEIKGGSFSGGKNDTLASAGALTVVGGTFDQDPSAYVVEDCIAFQNGDGLYVVAPMEMSVTYQTHVQDYGWQDWVADGEMSGTSGESKRLEAIEIQLTGDMAELYDVYYRVHCQNIGWMGWAKNGEPAGSEGYAYRLEGIEILLIHKAIEDKPVSDEKAFTSVFGDGAVNYTTHVQNIGWQDYVSDGDMAGTSGKSLRLEGIKVNTTIDGLDISYRTHVQNIGWQDFVSNGEMSGTSGKSLRLEAIEIQLSGEKAELYDVYYRVHCQNIGWMGWAKNGESAGSAGYSYRLEGIEIVLVEKGAEAPGSTEGAFAQK